MAAGVVPQSSCSLRPQAPARTCSMSGSGTAGVALTEEATVHGQCLGGLEHPGDVPRPGRAGGGACAVGRAGAAANERGDAVGQRLVDLLWRDHVDVAVDAARRCDQMLAGDDLRARADHQMRVDAIHGVRVAGLAHPDDAALLDADVAP